MAHLSCKCGNILWDGDGKPTVWAYRLNYFKNYLNEEPDTRLSLEHGITLFDFLEEKPKENLDIWHCDKCGGIQVFQYDSNHEYWKFYEPKMEEDIDEANPTNDADWEKYIVFNSEEFNKFEIKTDGWFLSSAINEYENKKIAYVSKDERLINFYNYEINKVIRYELIDQKVIERNSELNKTDYSTYKYVTVYYLDDVLGTYTFISNNLDIKLYDKVLVPRGNQVVMARVIDIGEAIRYDASSSHEKLKEVIKIIKD